MKVAILSGAYGNAGDPDSQIRNNIMCFMPECEIENVESCKTILDQLRNGE